LTSTNNYAGVRSTIRNPVKIHHKWLDLLWRWIRCPFFCASNWIRQQ